MYLHSSPAFLAAPLPTSFLSSRLSSSVRHCPRACSRPSPSPSRPPSSVPTPRSLDAALSALSSRRADTSPAAPAASAPPALPTVHLVGTGPGDPSMLTLGAVSLMQRADVVLYDRLVTPSILSYVADDATMVYVGKEKGYHTRSQDQIHDLLHAFAAEKKDAVIVRLKGGDPFVFGRGGEEVAFLEQNSITVEVTPGITAAAGIAASLGLPLTMRGVAEAVKFVTGHRANNNITTDNPHPSDVVDVPPTVPYDPRTTLVVYMGLGAVETLVRTLIGQGMPEDTPVVAVERGTTPEETVVWARAGGVAEAVQERRLQSPTLLILGNVVRCAPGWNAWCAECEGDHILQPSPQNQIHTLFSDKNTHSPPVQTHLETRPPTHSQAPSASEAATSAPNC